MAKKENLTKGNKTAIEAAQELIQKKNQADCDKCAKELNEAKQEILKKYGCVEAIHGRYVGNQIEHQISIVKAQK